MSHDDETRDDGAVESGPQAGPFVVGKLQKLDADLLAALPRVKDEADEDAIHDLRVAIRRLRTLLKVARPIFGRFHADVVRKAFAEVMRATGDLRDEEVLEETLTEASDEPSFRRWVSARKSRERTLRDAVTERIQGGELDRARLLLKAMLVFPIRPDRQVPLARFARRTVEKARRGVEKKRDAAVEDVEGLHELRIAYKELRYSIELLEEALPIDVRAMLGPATVFQKRLGELHDVDVATTTLREDTELASGARDAALSGLARRRQKLVLKYLRELDPLSVPAKPGEGSPVDDGPGARGFDSADDGDPRGSKA